MILRAQKAPKPYVYNGLGDFETSKAPKPYVYNCLEAFESATSVHTLRI